MSDDFFEELERKRRRAERHTVIAYILFIIGMTIISYIGHEVLGAWN